MHYMQRSGVGAPMKFSTIYVINDLICIAESVKATLE